MHGGNFCQHQTDVMTPAEFLFCALASSLLYHNTTYVTLLKGHCDYLEIM